jgi:hypothetical protein
LLTSAPGNNADSALAVRARRQQQLALGGQRLQLRTQQAEGAVVETHGADRRLNLAVLDPERREAGHAGQARRRLIRVVQVPQVADVQPGAQLLEDFCL